MMKLIAHRGNINGPHETRENSPDYILETIQQGYDCEIDVRYISNILYLGHHHADYKIEIDFLFNHADKLWIHCKNIEALSYLMSYSELNVFWHQEDNYTLTSKGFIWSFPTMEITTNSKTIQLMPEWNGFIINPNAYGICSDYITKIEREEK